MRKEQLLTTAVAMDAPADRLIPDVRLSDHSPFWDAGTNNLMVSDTSFLRKPIDQKKLDTIDMA